MPQKKPNQSHLEYLIEQGVDGAIMSGPTSSLVFGIEGDAEWGGLKFPIYLRDNEDIENSFPLPEEQVGTIVDEDAFNRVIAWLHEVASKSQLSKGKPARMNGLNKSGIKPQ